VTEALVARSSRTPLILAALVSTAPVAGGCCSDEGTSPPPDRASHAVVDTQDGGASPTSGSIGTSSAGSGSHGSWSPDTAHVSYRSFTVGGSENTKIGSVVTSDWAFPPGFPDRARRYASAADLANAPQKGVGDFCLDAHQDAQATRVTFVLTVLLDSKSADPPWVDVHLTIAGKGDVTVRVQPGGS
jgi:hypothetical protein